MFNRPYHHHVEKWSNIFLKSCGVNTVRFLKYVWHFSILCLKGLSLRNRIQIFLRLISRNEFGNLSVIRQKGESQNRCYKQTKHAKFSEKTNISYPLIRTSTYPTFFLIFFFKKRKLYNSHVFKNTYVLGMFMMFM